MARLYNDECPCFGFSKIILCESLKIKRLVMEEKTTPGYGLKRFFGPLSSLQPDCNKTFVFLRREH
jgi:hypothetical protein